MPEKRKGKPEGSRLLAEAIEASEVSKTELAASLGISLGHLRHLETGRRRPLLPAAVALEDKLQIPIRSWL
jgi:DNA-binding transcriptional regulator YiaG